MKYIAFLRGINISGKNKISMALLKEGFISLGYKDVLTYLNSGNVIFSSNDDKDCITENVHFMIKEKFGFDIPVYIITSSELDDILRNGPKWWGTGDKKIYDNIIFVIPPMTCDEIYNVIGETKKDIEIVKKYKNIYFWSYKRDCYRKSNWWVKTASTSISNSITIRTGNTVKKVLELSKII